MNESERLLVRARENLDMVWHLAHTLIYLKYRDRHAAYYSYLCLAKRLVKRAYQRLPAILDLNDMIGI